MAAKITKITAAQANQMPAFVQRWIDIGLSTEPADFDAATAAALRAYDLCGLPRPSVILRMGSPYAATVGGALAWMIVRCLSAKDLKQQVRQQVRQQVWQQVEQQVRQQVEQQVVRQVRQQVLQQVEQQVEQQVWQQVRQQVGQQVRQQVRQQVHILNAACDGFLNYGSNSLWASWSAHIAFMRDVLGWSDPVLTERFEIEETLVKSCGWTWWHTDVLVIGDRPVHINRDAQGRLHSLTGPSIAYRDGWALHHVHGVAVPEYIVERPQEITCGKIDAERNAEVRRVMLERFGVERYMRESDATVIAEIPDTHPIIGLRGARLIKREIPDDEPIVTLDVMNSSPEPDGSFRRYMLRIDPQAYAGKASTDVLAAMASTWRNADGSLLFRRPEDYQPTMET